MNDKAVLRASQLHKYLGVSRTHFNTKLRKRGDFPAPFPISENINVWLKSDIDAWILARKAG